MVSQRSNQEEDKASQSSVNKSQRTQEVQIKQINFKKIIERNKLRLTTDRIHDFRKTMDEIVGLKNGLKPSDY